jgi:hypothetical protein
MKIEDVKSDFIKIGDIVKNIGASKASLMMIPCVGNEILKNKTGRVYLIVVNKEIKKIGASNAKTGIKGTISSYLSGNTGRPSIRSFGIQKLMLNEIERGNSIEIYCIFSKEMKVKISGLFEEKIRNVNISAIDIEDFCKNDFYEINGKYPDWNFQENGKSWPLEIQKSHSEYIGGTLNK